MGREVRKVPADWEHPTDESGDSIPLLKGYSDAVKRWATDKAQWDRGFIENYSNGGWEPRAECELASECASFVDWTGEEPEREDYMPNWPEDVCTHIQMYEDTSEGTPISPVFDNPEDMARWLADNNASAFGSDTATYEQWLSVAKSGWAPSAVMEGGCMKSGVAFMVDTETEPA